MRTSREWIEKTLAGLDEPVPPAVANGPGRPKASRQAAADRMTFELTLSEAELEALDVICREGDFSPKQALQHIVRARLLKRPQFGRADRVRLRACLEVLRALEQLIGRAARPAASPERSALGREVLIRELLGLGLYLRQVGQAIGGAMTGNLEYWSADPAAEVGEEAPFDAAGAPETTRARRSAPVR